MSETVIVQLSQQYFLKRIATLESDLAQARKDESKVSGLLFDEIAHREKVEKELDAAHACLREVRGLLRDTHQSGAVIEAVQLIDKVVPR